MDATTDVATNAATNAATNTMTNANATGATDATDATNATVTKAVLDNGNLDDTGCIPFCRIISRDEIEHSPLRVIMVEIPLLSLILSRGLNKALLRRQTVATGWQGCFQM